jgi:hypothetical protein
MQFHEVIRLEDPDRIFAEGGAMEAMLDAKKAGIQLVDELSNRSHDGSSHLSPAGNSRHLVLSPFAGRHTRRSGSAHRPIRLGEHGLPQEGGGRIKRPKWARTTCQTH